MSAVTDVLNGAADLIERDGWCQGTTSGPNGERCVDQALFDLAGEDWWDARDVMRQMLGINLGTLYTWNDAPGRTKAEVVAALRAAAERAA